ncbi:hypothetical protein [Poriferisphaera sp. WC338]|uniref:hypothetical protein n=1 Tax=Poriferisphaera sp. WC338 TaxID=3425129 RepID=UPI003D815E1D
MGKPREGSQNPKKNGVNRETLPPIRGGRKFICPEIQDLCKQLLFSPAAQRHKQFLRAEQLHDEIQTNQNYPLEFLIYKITNRRLGSSDAIILAGRAIRPDLRLMIDQLTDSLELSPSDLQESMLSTQQLAAQLNISTKTLSRWRSQGLRWRKIRVIANRRKQVLFTEQAVELFKNANHSLIENASNFVRLNDTQREDILNAARKITAENPSFSFNQVATQAAAQTSTALETVRYLLEKHDKDHPDNVIIQQPHGLLNQKTTQLVIRAYRRGIKPSQIAERIGRSRTTIFRIILDHRIRELDYFDLTYITSRVYDRDDADEVILGRDLDQILDYHKLDAAAIDNQSLPDAILTLFQKPRLKDTAIRSLMVRYHYLKFKATHARNTLDRKHPKAGDVDSFMQLIEQIESIRSIIIQSHLPIVLSLVKRQLIDHPQHRAGLVVSLLVFAINILGNTIDHYDPSRSTTFNTSIKNRILKELAVKQAAIEKSGKASRRESESMLVDKLQKQIDRVTSLPRTA